VTNPYDRIIDNDVAFYTADHEHCLEQLSRCTPSVEAHFAARAVLSQKVLDALVEYRAFIDRRGL
jgi:hypothetical protein